MTHYLRAAIGFALLTVGTARADIVVPNSATSVEGDGTFSLTTTGATGRTYQFSIAANQLTGMIGQQINGLQWRLNGASTSAWPPVDANFSSFDIFVGPGVAPGSTSATFASNYTSSSIQVRSGALTIPAGSFTFGGSPNAFGPTLTFTTPYFYTGGNMTMDVRMAQQTGATTQSPFDGMLASGGPTNGWGVDFSARFAAGSTATTATTTTANFLVTNFSVTAVPEPTTVAFVGLLIGAVASWAIYRRRKYIRRRYRAA